MSFTESNTVEQMILDAIAKCDSAAPSLVREDLPGWGMRPDLLLESKYGFDKQRRGV